MCIPSRAFQQLSLPRPLTRMCNTGPSSCGGEAGKRLLFSRRSVPAGPLTFCLNALLRPVCHGSPRSSQGNLLLPERWSPCLLPYCLAFPAPIKLSQSAGLETGEGRKKFEGSREFGREGASHHPSCSSVCCQIGLKTWTSRQSPLPPSFSPLLGGRSS